MKGRWSNMPSVPKMPRGVALGLLAFLCAAHLQLHATVAAGLRTPTATRRSLLGESDHKYAMGDAINLYANKVGPFHNPRFA